MSNSSPQEIRINGDRRMAVPLHWLLSSGGSILLTLAVTLWNIAGQSNKLDQLITSNAKMEKRLDDRDTRIDTMRDKLFICERSIDSIQVRLDMLERLRAEQRK
jgi:hypothetical protein